MLSVRPLFGLDGAADQGGVCRGRVPRRAARAAPHGRHGVARHVQGDGAGQAQGDSRVVQRARDGDKPQENGVHGRWGK